MNIEILMYFNYFLTNYQSFNFENTMFSKYKNIIISFKIKYFKIKTIINEKTIEKSN